MSRIDHEARRKFLGASDVAAALGLYAMMPGARKRTPYDVWAEKTGRVVPDESDSPAAQAGRRLELAALDYAADRLGALEIGVPVNHPMIPYFRSSLDARVVATGEPVEGKTTGIVGPVWQPEAWGEEGSADVPDLYFVQVCAQLACTQAEVGHLLALIGGRGDVLFTIRRNVEQENIMLDAIEKFWQCVQSDTPPENSLPSMDTIRRMRRVPKKIISIPSALMTARLEAKERLKEAEDAFEIADVALKAALQDAEAGVDEFGRGCTFYEQSRASYVAKACTFRVLRFPKKGAL